MNHLPRRVVIVGGGTAGWMTATYLAKTLGTRADITLVESASIPTIGVGEATFSSIKAFFDQLDLDETDWMPSCDATYKMSIRFVDWNADRRVFHHPFEGATSVGGFALSDWWLQLLRGRRPYDYSCFVVPSLCDHGRSPRYLDGRVFDDRVQFLFEPDSRDRRLASLSDGESRYPYAYHFDAAKLAGFLADFGVRLGVKRVLDTVTNVSLAPDGSIAGIETEQSGSLVGDLYVDCTGFRGLLLNQALGEPFVPYSSSLPNDRAVALRVPYASETPTINPHTTATALSAGWVWNIPLYNRVGTGYVYCSDFLSEDAAEAELREHLGDVVESAEANHIRMRVGRSRNSWVKNCVGIGLASGFVEPLESTGIFFIQHGVEELVNHFPFDDQNDVNRLSYNSAVNQCIDGIRDFLILHYAASDRDDNEYWRSLKNLVIPEELADRLRVWATFAPNNKNVNPAFHGFQTYSYTCILFGLNYLPSRTRVLLESDGDGRAKAEQAFVDKQHLAQHLVSALPSHHEYLTRMRADL